MEIWTLFKANARKKKGTLLGIAILTAIVMAVVVSIFSIRENYERGYYEAWEESKCGEVLLLIDSERMTQELRDAVENNALVSDVQYIDCICANGMHCGEYDSGNSQFLTQMRDGIKVLNEKLDDTQETPSELRPGEIYIPLGLKEKIYCEVGDTLVVDFIYGVSREFVIKGFVEEPAQGALTIGWKQLFVCEEDLQSIYEECKPLDTEEITLEVVMLMVNRVEGCELSVSKFQRQLNMDTKVVDVAFGALNSEQSARYSMLLLDIITDVVLVFAVFLFVIIMIVMSHSIGTEIEIDYVTLGVLKSQGFSRWQLRKVILLQYMVAQLVGIGIGSLIALPIIDVVGDESKLITGVLSKSGLNIGQCAICSLAILLISTMLVFWKTRKIAAISPVRAISGGKEEIYFEPHLNAPINKKGLLISLAFREFSSAKKRYIGTILIVAILMFFMITMNLVRDMLSSEDALRKMGIAVPDIEMFCLEETETDYMAEVERIIESYSPITEKNAMFTQYISLNGENLLCQMYEKPQYIGGVWEGREPIYDNEVVVTEMVAELLEIEIGDEVIVSTGNAEVTCLVSGIFQSTWDSGTTYAMGFGVVYRLDPEFDATYVTRSYVLEDTSKQKALVDEILAKYGDVIGVNAYYDEDNSALAEYEGVVVLLQSIITIFSMIFAFVAVQMVCTKAFIQERIDIGIYKAIGFSTGKLRMQFSIRFAIIAFLGTVIGILMGSGLSEKVLGMFFSVLGLSKIEASFSMTSVIVPFVLLIIGFFVSSFHASRKIKGVAIRELVTE